MGENKLYVVKKLNEFCENVKNASTAVYGSSTNINHNIENFTEESRKWIHFINQVVRDEDIMRHWNETERAWYINPREYDVEHDTIKLYVPTLEKDQAILDWAVAQARAKKKIKDTFLKYLPWLLPKAPKDEKVLDKFIKDCELQYDSWDGIKPNFMRSSTMA